MDDNSLQWSIHPLIAAVQIGNSLYVTALPMMMKDRCVNSTRGGASNSTLEDSWQNSMSSFYMTCKILSQLLPIIPCLFLAWLGDRGWRKVAIVVPLLGLILARVVMLLMLTLDWPLDFLYMEVTLAGVCGGVTAVWGETLTLLSLSSTKQDRSHLLMRAEVTNGIAGMVGSVASGYLYSVTAAGFKPGVMTMMLCLVANVICMLYVIFFLQVNKFKDLRHQNRLDTNQGVSNQVANIVLLCLAVVLYGAAVSASKSILVLFELMGPLHWDITQVGYGDASGFLVIVSSFLSAMILSRWVSDLTLITIGMLSHSASLFLTAFVTKTYMFYTARSLTFFSPMPIPVIRSLLCQQVNGSSYGIALTSMQLSLKISSVIYIQLYTKIFDHTLNWFPGFVYIVSSLMATAAIIPLRIIDSRLVKRRCCWRVSKDEEGDSDNLSLLTYDSSDYK